MESIFELAFALSVLHYFLLAGGQMIAADISTHFFSMLIGERYSKNKMMKTKIVNTLN